MVWFVLPAAAAAESVDLAQAIESALGQRPQVEASRQQAEAAQAGAAAARSGLLPRLTLQENFVWTDEPATGVFLLLNQEGLSPADMSGAPDTFNDPPARHDFETRLALVQPLYDPDLFWSWKRAEKGAEASAAYASQVRENAAYAAFQAYLQVQTATAAAAWAQSSLAEAMALETLAADRQAAGTGLKADWLRARAARAEAEARNVQSGNRLWLAKRSLALAIGRAEGVVDIAGPVEADLFNAVEASSPLQRPDLTAKSLEAEAAGLAWRQSRGAYRPRAQFEASYGIHDEDLPLGGDADSWLVRVGLRWVLFDAGGRRRGIERAAALKRASEAEYREAWRQAALAVEEADRRSEEAEKILTAAQEGLAAAEEGHRLLLQRYEAGLTDTSEVLSAKAALDQARYRLVEAESQRLLALGNRYYQRGTFLAVLPLSDKENAQ